MLDVLLTIDKLLNYVSRQSGETRIAAYALLRKYFGEGHTPPDQRIEMDDNNHPEQLIELILWNFSKKRFSFQMSFNAWHSLLDFMKSACFGENQDLTYLGLQLIFLSSRLDFTECFDKEMNQNEKETLADRRLFLCIIDWVDSFGNLKPTDVVNLADPHDVEVRKFLYHPFVLKTLLNRLNEILPKKVTIDDIKLHLKNMRIHWFTSLIGSGDNEIRGWAVSNGICIISRKLPAENPFRCAGLYTLCVHECGHYLSRKLVGDYAFMSPVFLNNKATRFDPKNPEKALELGRAVELDLFGEQVDWTKTETYYNCVEYAKQFLSISDNSNWNSPLFDDECIKHLKLRMSTSFAGFDFNLVNESVVFDFF